MRDGYDTTAPVLVTGGTGNVGREVVERLVSAGVPVRAAGATRGEVVTAGGGERALTRRGITPVGLDFEDPGTWRRAYDGVEQLFLMRPPHLGRPRTQMLPSLDAARAAGVSQVVLLSLQGAEQNRLVPHATLEAWLRESGLVWTFVRPSFFMQNLTTTHLTDIRDRDEIVVPAGHGATAFVDAGDVAAVGVEALLHRRTHAHRAWTPTGAEALTYQRVAGVLTDVLHRRITYTAPGVLAYARHARRTLGMPWGMVAVTGAIYTVARLGRAAGLTDDVRTVTGRAPVSFADFALRHRGAWRRS